MRYLIQYFDAIDGKRYHYSHIDGDKKTAIKEFLRSRVDSFKDDGVKCIICLHECKGGRKGSLREGAGGIGFDRVIAVKGFNAPARSLRTFCININDNCEVYLRESSELAVNL